MPESSEIKVPLVTVADDVLEHSLRRSPKPGALTAALEAAAQLVNDQRGQCLTLDVLGDDEECLPACTIAPAKAAPAVTRRVSSR